MLTEIHRYPVKSLQGESLNATALLPNGVAGDRCWAVRDEERGGIRGAKVIHQLMDLSATYDSGANLEMATAAGRVLNAQITLPDGSTCRTNDPDINARLSDALGHAVTLWPLQPAHDTDHYRRGAPVLEDMEQEFRRLFARDADEPLPDVSKFPPELAEYESPPGTYFDAHSLLLCSTAALERLKAKHAERNADTTIDLRRFRPNLVVDEELDEAALTGKRLRLGEAELQIEIPCPRCIMTTLPFAELQKDPSIMRTLVQDFSGDFGLYASVAVPGEVRLGDRLEPID